MNKLPFKKIVLYAGAFLLIYSVMPAVLLYSQKSKVSDFSSRTAVTGEGSGSFEFIVFGDNHAGMIFNDSATLKLVRSINREDRFKKLPVDFVIIAGDVTNRGSKWDYKIFNKISAMIKWPVMCAIGNHDDDDDKGENTTYFTKDVGERERSFANRNSYFIFIDNAIGDLTDEQFAKLDQELIKGSSYAHRFIVLHKSPISPYIQSWYRPELSPWAYRFMKLCEKHKVDMVFSGHEHLFSEKIFGGVKYIVTGGGGMLTQIPSWEGGYLHYLVVRVNGDYVDYEVRQIVPPFWELATYYWWKDLFYLLKYTFM